MWFIGLISFQRYHNDSACHFWVMDVLIWMRMNMWTPKNRMTFNTILTKKENVHQEQQQFFTQRDIVRFNAIHLQYIRRIVWHNSNMFWLYGCAIVHRWKKLKTKKQKTNRSQRAQFLLLRNYDFAKMAIHLQCQLFHIVAN